MTLALVSNGKVATYPYTSLREDNPSTGFPTDLAGVDLTSFGVVTVAPSPMPDTTPDEIAEEATPVKAGSGWQQTWTVRKRTAGELDLAKTLALMNLAALRYTKETAGITFGGATIPTDRQTCAILTGAYVRADKDPAFAIAFKSPSGAFLPIDAPTIIAVGNAVSDHVQACFRREAELSTTIKAAQTFTELAAVDTVTGWPS